MCAFWRGCSGGGFFSARLSASGCDLRKKLEWGWRYKEEKRTICTVILDIRSNNVMRFCVEYVSYMILKLVPSESDAGKQGDGVCARTLARLRTRLPGAAGESFSAMVKIGDEQAEAALIWIILSRAGKAARPSPALGRAAHGRASFINTFVFCEARQRRETAIRAVGSLRFGWLALILDLLLRSRLPPPPSPPAPPSSPLFMLRPTRLCLRAFQYQLRILHGMAAQCSGSPERDCHGPLLAQGPPPSNMVPSQRLHKDLLNFRG